MVRRAWILMKPFFRSLEHGLGWAKGWAAHLTYEEMEAGLLGNGFPAAHDMAARHKQQYVAVYTPLGTTVTVSSQE